MGGGEATGAGEVKWGAAVVGYDIHTSGGKQHAVRLLGYQFPHCAASHIAPRPYVVVCGARCT